MRSKTIAIFIILIVLIIALVIGTMIFFKDRFYPRTTLNIGPEQLDISLKTYNTVAEEIMNMLENKTYTVIDSYSNEHNVKLNDIITEINKQLLLDKVENINKKLGESEYTLDLSGVILLDQDKINSFLDKIASEKKESQNAYVFFDESLKEFAIKPEYIGNIYVKNVCDLFKNNFDLFKNTINLLDLNAYELPEITKDNPDLLSDLEKLNSMKDVVIEYSFGNNQETLDMGTFHSWLSLTDEGLSIDKEKVKEYVKDLNEKYTTVGKAREFKTSLGNQVTLNKGNYGWLLDTKKMEEDILEHLNNKESIKKEGIYKKKAESYGDLDFSDSYVEISIANQRLWMYVNGELIVECPVVTGCVKDGHSTPTGVYSLTYKTRNTVLRGPDYAVPVSYWMPFNGGIGLHDATWRSSFGGNIYKTNGSHGCVNMPLQSAKKVYENITNTMPIIVW